MSEDTKAEATDERRVQFRATLMPDIFDRIEVRAFVRGENGRRHARGLPLQFKEVEPAAVGYFVAPTLSLTKDEAQALMDELWRVGLRPTEGSGSAGSLAATQRHLEDMRALAFAKLEVAKLEVTKP